MRSKVAFLAVLLSVAVFGAFWAMHGPAPRESRPVLAYDGKACPEAYKKVRALDPHDPASGWKWVCAPTSAAFRRPRP
jgi:hypothetical protein